MRTERQKEQRRKYEASEKGKLAKRRHEEAYKTSGGRAKAEEKRSNKPLSEARKACKLKYQLVRRSNERSLNEIDSLVLLEAIDLCKLRNIVLGGIWHVDHIAPVSKGGTSSFDNLQVVPGLWNRKKSNKHTGRFFARA
jgi:CRISPR/Cas system Type II protein with McrA/HNH and RuvC-like nuclease domain